MMKLLNPVTAPPLTTVNYYRQMYCRQCPKSKCFAMIMIFYITNHW